MNKKRHNQRVFIFSEIEWSFLRQRHHFLTEALVEEGMDVFFIQKVPSRIPPLADLIKIALRTIWHSNRANTDSSGRDLGGNLTVCTSRFLPPINALFRFWNKYYASRYYAKRIGSGYAYLFTPTAASLVSHRERYRFKILFDVIHNWWELPWNDSLFSSLASTLVVEADVVITDSAPIGQFIEAEFQRKPTVVLPGVPSAWLKSETDESPNPISRPLGAYSAIFFGNLRENSDHELLLLLAEAGIRVDAYGYCNVRIRRQLETQVTFYKPVTQETLVKIALKYDFILLPFSATNFSKTITPAKYFETLALGKLILTRSNLKHLPGWHDCTFFVSCEGRELKHQLAIQLKKFNSGGAGERAKNIAKDFSWDRQASKLIAEILGE